MSVQYVIKLITPTGNRGYVYDSNGEIIVVQNGYDPNITLFSDVQSARTFIKERKLEKKGIKAFVRTTIEMVDDQEFGGAVPVTGEMYYVENDEGQRVFQNTQTGDFFFRKQEVGFCCWNQDALEELNKLVEGINSEFPDMNAQIKNMSGLPK